MDEGALPSWAGRPHPTTPRQLAAKASYPSPSRERGSTTCDPLRTFAACALTGPPAKLASIPMGDPKNNRWVSLSTAVIIVGLIAATAVAVIFVTNRSDYLVWDRGKVGMPRSLKQTEIRTDDLPELVEAMSRGRAPVRYAALIFSAPDRPSDQDALNLQISVENDKAGFDWVLLAPRNIEDQEKFRIFARAHGLEPVARSENGVSYLRVESPNVAKFAASVATEMYHHPASAPLGLVYEGFEWR